MKSVLVSILITLMLLVLGSPGFAEPGDGPGKRTNPSIPPQDESPYTTLPPDIRVENISKFLDSQSLAALSAVSKRDAEESLQVDQANWKERWAKVELLMSKYGEFIQLPNGGRISPVAPTQELWVEVLGTNPSYFKEKKYCPKEHRTVQIRGTRVEMCPEFPVEKTSPRNEGKRDSDEELITEIKRIYRKAGVDADFRGATLDEYNYADTEDGMSPKLADHKDLPYSHLQFLGRYTPYDAISDKDPHDLTKPSPSGEHQPRSISDNAANKFGFRRSGVWERPYMIGGSWGFHSDFAESDKVMGFLNGHEYFYRNQRSSNVGSTRLVRTQ